MYEGTVAELQGQLFGGCMSSADRANEIGESRSALQLMHEETGKIMTFHAGKAQRKAYAERLSTQHKHNAVEMATGSPGTKDRETLGINPLDSGLAIEAESKDEYQQSAIAGDLRHLKAKGEVDDDYQYLIGGKTEQSHALMHRGGLTSTLTAEEAQKPALGTNYNSLTKDNDGLTSTLNSGEPPPLIY